MNRFAHGLLIAVCMFLLLAGRGYSELLIACCMPDAAPAAGCPEAGFQDGQDLHERDSAVPEACYCHAAVSIPQRLDSDEDLDDFAWLDASALPGPYLTAWRFVRGSPYFGSARLLIDQSELYLQRHTLLL